MRVSRPITLVVHARHLMLLEALAAAFDGDPTMAVVAATTDADLLPDIMEERMPSVCLCDTDASDPDCASTIRAVTRRAPATAVVVLVDEPSPAFVRELADAGVRGFIRKDANLRNLRTTIDRVCATRAIIGVDALRARPQRVGPPPRAAATAANLEQLTGREHEVLDHILAGEDTRHIAVALQISRSTARTHVQNVRRKLGARTKLQVVALACGTAVHPSVASGSPAWSMQ